MREKEGFVKINKIFSTNLHINLILFYVVRARLSFLINLAAEILSHLSPCEHKIVKTSRKSSKELDARSTSDLKAVIRTSLTHDNAEAEENAALTEKISMLGISGLKAKTLRSRPFPAKIQAI